jgi:DNA-binding MarR family transcriptional regulator
MMYFTMSNISDDLPEPDAFSQEEFLAWRGLIRLRETVMREIDRRLQREGLVSLADYGVLITLVTEPARRLRMSDLGARRMLTPSGITRVVSKLEQQGLVRREPDPADGRAAFAVLTPDGVRALRRAQVVHHAAVRELYLGRLEPRELGQLARLFEKALPGVVTAREWPPPGGLHSPPARGRGARAPQGSRRR